MNNGCQLSMQQPCTIGSILCNRAKDPLLASFRQPPGVKAETGAEYLELMGNIRGLPNIVDSIREFSKQNFCLLTPAPPAYGMLCESTASPAFGYQASVFYGYDHMTYFGKFRYIKSSSSAQIGHRTRPRILGTNTQRRLDWSLDVSIISADSEMCALTLNAWKVLKY